MKSNKISKGGRCTYFQAHDLQIYTFPICRSLTSQHITFYKTMLVIPCNCCVCTLSCCFIDNLNYIAKQDMVCSMHIRYSKFRYKKK